VSPTELAVTHQRQRERLATAAAKAAGQAWRRIDADDIRGSWQEHLTTALAAVTGAQLGAAQTTEPWLIQLLGRDVQPPEADRLAPQALAGTTLDGRPLASALLFPAITALTAIGNGVPLLRALAGGAALLDLTVRTLITDTGRAADQVGMITRPAVTSYIRVVSSGACSRCTVLAGREYGISSGFLRHPRCACGMEPITRQHRPAPQSPEAIFDAMSPAQRQKRFGEDGTKAIEDGADVGQVVNARRGMSSAGAYRRKLTATTSEGTTRRGVHFRREFQRLQDAGDIPRSATSRGRRLQSPRLTPEEIYRTARSREQAIEMLRLHSYLI
jgi:hypothetical protein